MHTPRPHQNQAIRAARTMQNPALFMEMRLGKTLVCIRSIKAYKQNKRILVVAPGSALGSWVEELEREHQEYTLVLGSAKQKKSALLSAFSSPEDGESRWFLTNKESHLHLPQLSLVRWDVVVLDESTFIKNPQAQVTKFFISKFRTVKHKWILTGTPNPESSLDFVCQFLFLYGDFLGCNNYWEARSRYFIQNGYVWSPKPGFFDKLQNLLDRGACVQTRKNVGLGRKKIRERRMLELPSKLRKAYTTLEDEFIVEYNGEELRSTKWQGAKYQILRQMTSGWVENGYVWDGKFTELLELLLGELKQEPVVVWYSFNQDIRETAIRLKKRNIKFGILWGEEDWTSREKTRKEFQLGKFRVLLVQTMVARTGMNLSRAQTAIYFSEPTGFLDHKQTEDRILQTGIETPLLYIYLVVKDTVDADIHDIIKIKGLRSSSPIQRVLRNAQKHRVMQRVGRK